MSPKQFVCTRCGKDYSYKSGLAAHIKNKHPLKSVETEKNNQVKKPEEPALAAKKSGKKMPNLSTQEVDNLLAEEEEFYDAIDEIEHGIGINQSMFDWANVNFNSSFGASGEFDGRASAVQLFKCDECETNSKTIDKQMELLTKSDKKLIDCQDKLKARVKQVKQLEIKLEDALKALKMVQHKEDVEPQTPIPSIKCRECEFVCENENELREHKRTKKAEYRANNPAYNSSLQEGPLPETESKCEKCNFVSKNRVLLEEHKEKTHNGIQCTRCSVLSPDMESFKKHGEKYHGYPGYALNFKCTPCNTSYRNGDDLMEHMSQVHLTESQREGHGLFKYPSYHESNNERKPLCRNGPQCFYHRQGRCNFFHRQASQGQQRRPRRQAPSSQWKEVPTSWNHVQQGQRVQSPHEPRAQGHKYWSVPPQGVQSVPWCKHGRGCPMGQYCVLRHEDTDFPNLHQQGGY